MKKDQEEYKDSLERQLQWTKDQIRILDEMDFKLQEMKKIAERAAEYKLTANEIKELTSQLNKLKNEYDNLEKQLHPVYH